MKRESRLAAAAARREALWSGVVLLAALAWALWNAWPGELPRNDDPANEPVVWVRE